MFNCGNGKFWFQGSVSPAKTGSRVWYTGQFRFQGQCWNWLQDVKDDRDGIADISQDAEGQAADITDATHISKLIFRARNLRVAAKGSSSKGRSQRTGMLEHTVI